MGTDTPRRVAFLRAIRPDLEMHPLHGNVDTRLAKLDRGDSDALVLAVAGLTRLGRADRIDDILPAAAVPSAPGQGSLALQVRAEDAEAIAAVGLLDDADTRVAVEAERALLDGTGGGCRSPIGAIGTVRDGRLELVAGAERTWTPARGRGDHRVAGGLGPRDALRPTAPPGRAARAADRGAAGAAPGARRAAGARPRRSSRRWRPPGWRPSTCRPSRSARPPPAARSTRRSPRSKAGDIVVVTSANAARAMLRATTRMDVAPALLAWAAVGEATAAVLADAGLDGVFVPSEPTAATLAGELPVRPGDRVLVPHADIADRALAETLRARGAIVTDVIAYETVEAPETSRPLLAAALDDGPVDVLVLTSGSTARGLLALAGDDARSRLLATPVVAGGPATAAVARELGFSTVLQAPSPGALASPRSPPPRSAWRPEPPARPAPERPDDASSPTARFRRRRPTPRLPRPPGPAHRLRRTRRTETLRAFVRETRIHPRQLVAPMFVSPARGAASPSAPCPAWHASPPTRP